MTPPPIEDWTAALDRMNAALDQARGELDRHWTDWGALVATPAAASPPELLLAWLERRLAQWDARLSAAGELAAGVERELNDREAGVSRWREVVLRWRNLIEQGLKPTDTSTCSSG
jgi:hypothetical protein